jgi:hypothetical protein
LIVSLQIVRQLEAVNLVKEPLESDLLDGKWELLYTTSTSILQPQVPFPSRLGIITVLISPNNFVQFNLPSNSIFLSMIKTAPFSGLVNLSCCLMIHERC